MNHMIDGDNGSDCQSPYHDEDNCERCQQQKYDNEICGCEICYERDHPTEETFLFMGGYYVHEKCFKETDNIEEILELFYNGTV